MLKYLTLLMKQIYEEEKKALLYQILAFTIHGEIVEDNLLLYFQ